MVYLLLVVGFVLLIKGADFFVDGSSNIAKCLGIPNIIIGLTLVAFGTSAPEAAVSITAVLKNSADLSVSNIIGSNIFNLLGVLGITAIFKDVVTKKEVVTKDYMFSLLCAFLLFGLIMINYVTKGLLVIGRISGVILLVVLGIYLFKLVRDVTEESKTKEVRKFRIMDLVLTLGGLLLVIFGGQLTVDSATNIARNLGISERVIGLTVVAIGTSLPELCTSLVALIKGEEDIAVGNVIGSNIFNILFILGVTSILKPILINFMTLIDIAILIGGTLLVFLYFNDLKIARKEGISMIILYILYCCYLFVR